MPTVAAVVIGKEEMRLSPQHPFIFGRADSENVVGLDPNDMGISAEAGSVEWAWGLWWVVNRSRKRRLLLDDGGGGTPRSLDCGHRHAITEPRLSVLVPGVIYTHRLEVLVPPEHLGLFQENRPSSGTLPGGDVRLSDRDLDAMVALFSGYLEDFPRRRARPWSYKEAAERLGPPWTQTTLRKQVERFRMRLARAGVYIDGAQANYDLADYLLGNGLLSPNDLSRLKSRP